MLAQLLLSLWLAGSIVLLFETLRDDVPLPLDSPTRRFLVRATVVVAWPVLTPIVVTREIIRRARKA